MDSIPKLDVLIIVAFCSSSNVVLKIGTAADIPLSPNCEAIEITEEQKIFIENCKLPKLLNGVFIDAYVEVIEVPASVHNFKFRLALIHFGILPSSIDSAITAILDPVNQEQLYSLWNFAPLLERADPKLIGMATQFQISPEALDQIFIYAGSI